MQDWIYVMDDAALLEGRMAPVYPLGINVVLARVDGIIYAVSGACAHMACPLFTGKLSGHTITCPCHDWRFDLTTGEYEEGPGFKLTKYDWKIQQGKIWVKTEEET